MSIRVRGSIYCKSSLRRIRLLLIGTAAAALAGGAWAQTVAQTQPATASGASTAASGEISEIVVTAEKRSENIQNVPASVQAISGDRLETLGVSSLTDLQGFVPSLTLSNYGAPGTNTLEIRGLGDGYLSDFAGPLVSTYVDDLAVGSSTSAGRASLFNLDLMPYDIERVEVLEGPQGTLYGADAMGGVIKYVLKQPDLTQFSGGIGGDVAHVDKSGSADYGARGFLNIPLIDGQMGLRISAFDNNAAGYIDNIGISKKDSNSSNESGGRVAFLWEPTDKLTLKAGALLQYSNAADSATVVLNASTGKPLYGADTTNTYFAEPIWQHFADYSLGGSYDFGFATLSSTASWSQLRTGIDQDFTNPYISYAGLPAGDLALWDLRTFARKASEETKLTSSEQGKFSWIVGQYYTRENAGENGTDPTFTSSYMPLPASENIFLDNVDSVYKEVALFGDVTYKLTDSFDLTGGGRWLHYSQDENLASSGLFGTGVVSPSPGGSRNVGTWMASARYHFDQDQMIYFRVATGFRPGTFNTPALSIPVLQSNPDTTIDYEIGYKSTLLDNRLLLTATVFHINWKNLQEEAVTSLGDDYITNSGNATSDGFEFSTTYRITHDLTLALSTSYTNARLTSDASLVGGMSGDQLPLSAKFAGYLSADYVHHVNDQNSFLAGVSYRYKDKIFNQFPGEAGGPVPLGPQDIVNAYAGWSFGATTLRLYGKNVFNNQSYTGIQYLLTPAYPRAVPVQPATFGLSLDYKFN